MAFSVYSYCGLGLSKEFLLGMRDSASLQLVSGKTVTSVSTSDMTTGYTVYANPSDVLKAVAMALSQLDPDTYGFPVITETVGYTR